MFNFIRDGMNRLPPGFRFQPTDEELVFQYLKRKILSCPLPTSVIPDVNVCKYDPWELPGDMESERYFFCNKETKYPNGNRVNRSSASGEETTDCNFPQTENSAQNSSYQLDKWVVCRVFLKNKGGTRNEIVETCTNNHARRTQPGLFDSVSSYSSSSSNSSSITDISSNEEDDELSSSHNFF
ncbi:NO APICAL MERISTEM PROTEIN EXPRESSED [Salix viminalis]|uniref:NO APICAL MERISTEM PROTEIN EXPRESSED n=1 Tax=Salix viminalis TaxID=40686 RepID=A0A9Q0NV12_SALVM|nr:NO APICAL MERISTEM PROTEIN EXPRESSED [Salix viminalis]